MADASNKLGFWTTGKKVALVLSIGTLGAGSVLFIQNWRKKKQESAKQGQVKNKEADKSSKEKQDAPAKATSDTAQSSNQGQGDTSNQGQGDTNSGQSAASHTFPSHTDSSASLSFEKISMPPSEAEGTGSWSLNNSNNSSGFTEVHHPELASSAYMTLASARTVGQAEEDKTSALSAPTDIKSDNSDIEQVPEEIEVEEEGSDKEQERSEFSFTTYVVEIKPETSSPSQSAAPTGAQLSGQSGGQEEETEGGGDEYKDDFEEEEEDENEEKEGEEASKKSSEKNGTEENIQACHGSAVSQGNRAAIVLEESDSSPRGKNSVKEETNSNGDNSVHTPSTRNIESSSIMGISDSDLNKNDHTGKKHTNDDGEIFRNAGSEIDSENPVINDGNSSSDDEFHDSLSFVVSIGEKKQ